MTEPNCLASALARRLVFEVLPAAGKFRDVPPPEFWEALKRAAEAAVAEVMGAHPVSPSE